MIPLRFLLTAVLWRIEVKANLMVHEKMKLAGRSRILANCRVIGGAIESLRGLSRKRHF